MVRSHSGRGLRDCAALSVVVVLVCSVLATTPAVAASGSAQDTHLAVPTLHWSGCGAPFECATAIVPLDYDKPTGAKISLALIRLPASDQSHRIGSIFINPGGPGGSGVDFVRGLGPILFSTSVRAHFDLVGFDPRGIIGSTPLQCFDNFDNAIGALAPFAFPVGRSEENAQQLYDAYLADSCARRGGAILDHMATADVARDLDLLRAAVGDRQLSYVGYSYGSYLGQTYANLFPDRVRALVIDGVLDPIAWSTGRDDQARTLPFSTRLHSDQGAGSTLHQFFVLCKRGGQNCAFSAGDPEDRYARLARRLLRHPVELPIGPGVTQTVTYADLVSNTLGSLYSSFSWPDLAQVLQELDTMSSPPSAARALQRLRSEIAADTTYPNFVEGSPGVFCSDSDNPPRFADWQRAARATDLLFGYFGRPWTWLSSVCQRWPGQDADRFTGPWTHRTANPVLVIGNRFDPATRYQGAVTAAKLLPNSQLLTVDGWGHTSLLAGSTCANAYTSRYLLTVRVPAAGTVCPVDVVPFSTSATTAPANLRERAASALIPQLLQRGRR